MDAQALPAPELDEYGEARANTSSWGSEEFGFSYDCLADEVVLF